mmetsp:Transcript_8662/g.15592  ORF Transcript_8662/g.15592 Transcript_8662/m.15592 type:complete len:84 (-) Transcript_8662:1455-1706(-)
MKWNVQHRAIADAESASLTPPSEDQGCNPKVRSIECEYLKIVRTRSLGMMLVYHARDRRKTAQTRGNTDIVFIAMIDQYGKSL